MIDALWSLAFAFACLLAWDGWRRWLSRQRADWEKRIASAELAERAIASECRRISDGLKTHEVRLADVCGRVTTIESDQGEIKRMATNAFGQNASGRMRLRR